MQTNAKNFKTPFKMDSQDGGRCKETGLKKMVE